MWLNFCRVGVVLRRAGVRADEHPWNPRPRVVSSGDSRKGAHVVRRAASGQAAEVRAQEVKSGDRTLGIISKISLKPIL